MTSRELIARLVFSGGTSPRLAGACRDPSVQFGAGIAKSLSTRSRPPPSCGCGWRPARSVLVLVARPRLRGRTGSDWFRRPAFGVALGTMNWRSTRPARIPLGVAVTLEFVGPADARRARLPPAARPAVGRARRHRCRPARSRRRWFAHHGRGPLRAAGGGCWAAYILLSAPDRTALAGLDGWRWHRWSRPSCSPRPPSASGLGPARPPGPGARCARGPAVFGDPIHSCELIALRSLRPAVFDPDEPRAGGGCARRDRRARRVPDRRAVGRDGLRRRASVGATRSSRAVMQPIPD